MQEQKNPRYDTYVKTVQRAADFNNASAVLGWDQEVYMPKKSFEIRGRQLATLASQAHGILTADSYGALLQELLSKDNLNPEEKRNVQLSWEDYEKGRKLSAAFVEALTQQSSHSFHAWLEARKLNDFKVYAPELEKMIDLKKQQAGLYGYEKHPYDALLDEYEPGMTVALLQPVFEGVKQELPPLLKHIKDAEQVDDSFFYQHFSKEKQWDFSLSILRQMGYDFEAGRQDYSEHPFTTSFGPTDVRITTRVNEKDMASLLWSSIHEGGHALYEQGLRIDQYGLPLGAAASLSVHESQSRLWENCVGRSLYFWKYFYPKLQVVFPDPFSKTSLVHFYKGMNKVQPSLVRTEADEVTYHFHVLIRYEIEQSLIEGSLNVKNVKEVWNSKYQQYLGISANDDLTGILQDVHWCHGSFGYFPTYSLGSFYAAQFFEQAVHDIQGLQEQITSGNFERLLKWLREKIHVHGRYYRSEELCKKITGRGLDFSSFMNYLEKKYTNIYAAKTDVR